ncbi:hypothetical protein D3C71_1188210 [compost metagenome]
MNRNVLLSGIIITDETNESATKRRFFLFCVWLNIAGNVYVFVITDVTKILCALKEKVLVFLKNLVTFR